MGDIATTGLHHLRLTVTDLQRSRAFYTEVLGFEVAAESPGDASDPAVRADPDQLYGGVVLATNQRHPVRAAAGGAGRRLRGRGVVATRGPITGASQSAVGRGCCCQAQHECYPGL